MACLCVCVSLCALVCDKDSPSVTYTVSDVSNTSCKCGFIIVRENVLEGFKIPEIRGDKAFYSKMMQWVKTSQADREYRE